MIKAILACDEAGGVSKDGTLPWPNNKTDMQWFRENTRSHIVVMGSTTWEDPHMPRPLPKRINVLATSRRHDYPGAQEYINGDLVSEIKRIESEYPSLITWIIGGPKIVEQTLGIIDEFYLSKIPGEYDCDTFLPLKKIETLFEIDYTETHPEVEFQILKKRNHD